MNLHELAVSKGYGGRGTKFANEAEAPGSMPGAGSGQGDDTMHEHPAGEKADAGTLRPSRK